ncbi:acyl dehydratase [Jatrophihabitans sp. GAS493]|uniref:MaoC family dehydratase n=1 Tax=Jatrophihabitans sp. GAS493 TaxID=1907575 RepID=UPI000BB8A5E3|nr:MaoC family dehydratase [Jatrophihabitans sp. GAS493]SOD72003.1 acyl dehydratase [Jatrophihabitans sp. GAS493]
MLIINGVDDAFSRAGQELGVSDWRKVEQADINTFADVTDDHQWIHVDVDQAKASPFGGTIAHGFYTLSMIPTLHASIFTVEGITHGLNYGLDRVRFPAPTPVGSSIRARVVLSKIDEIPGGAQVMFTTTVESDASEKPVCVAEFLVRFYGPRAESSVK